MESNQDPNYKSNIFNERYIKRNPNYYKAPPHDMMDYNTAYLPPEENANQRKDNGIYGNSYGNKNFINNNSNHSAPPSQLEHNYRHIYLNCSRRSEDYEVKFGEYQGRENYITEYPQKNTNEHSSSMTTYESLKFQNLNSNISITVNYENRHENVHNKNLMPTKREDFIPYNNNGNNTGGGAAISAGSGVVNHMKNSEISPKMVNCYGNLRCDSELRSKVNLNPQNLTSNNNFPGNNRIIHHRTTNDYSKIYSNYPDGNIRNSHDVNINNFNQTNNNNGSNPYNVSRQNNISNYCNGSINDNNNNDYYNKYNQSRIISDKPLSTPSTSRNNSMALKREEFVASYGPSNIMPVTEKLHQNQLSNKEVKQISVPTNFEMIQQSPIQANSPHGSNIVYFDTLHSKYPDISFNKSTKMKISTTDHTKASFEANYQPKKFQLSQNQVNPHGMIASSPKSVKQEMHSPANLTRLRPDINVKYVDQYCGIPSSFEERQTSIGVPSSQHLPRVQSSQFEPISESRLETPSSSLPRNYKLCPESCNKNNGLYSDGFPSKSYGNVSECSSYYETGKSIQGGIKTTSDDNVDYRSYVLNKSSSNNSCAANSSSGSSPISLNSSKLANIKMQDCRQSRPQNFHDNYSRQNSNYNVIVHNEPPPPRDCSIECSYKCQTGQNTTSNCISPLDKSLPSTSTKIINQNNSNDRVVNLKQENEYYEFTNQSNVAPVVSSMQLSVGDRNLVKYPISSNDPKAASVGGCSTKKMKTIKVDDNNGRNHNLKLPLKKSERIYETPNYRELLNQAYALKSARSEKDLDLEIIRRTLKCEVPPHSMQTATPSQSSTSLKSTKNSNHPNKIFKAIDATNKQNYLADRSISIQYSNEKLIYDSKNNMPCKSRCCSIQNICPSDSKPILSPVIRSSNSTPELSSTTPLIMKTSTTPIKTTTSPLDLSVKTIKSNADSTGSHNEMNFMPRNSIRNHVTVTASSPAVPILPKIDFHPNFSIVSGNQQSISNQPKIEKPSCALDLSEQGKSMDRTLQRNFEVIVSTSQHQNSLQNFDFKPPDSKLKIPLNKFVSAKESKASIIESTAITSCKIDNPAIDLTANKNKVSTIMKVGVKILSPNLNYNLPSETIVSAQVPKTEIKGIQDEVFQSSSISNELPHPSSIKIERETACDIGSDENSTTVISNNDVGAHDIMQHDIKKSSHSNHSNEIFQSTSIKSENVPKGKEGFENYSEEIKVSNSSGKCDADSLRIRTKAELKGFDLSLLSQSNGKNEEIKRMDTEVSNYFNLSDIKEEDTSDAELNLSDWNTKCNDFVSQLTCGNITRKNGRIVDNSIGRNKCTINVTDMIAENKSNFDDRQDESSSSSSEEDKPLNKLSIDTTKMLSSEKRDFDIQDNVQTKNEENSFKGMLDSNFVNSLVEKLNQLNKNKMTADRKANVNERLPKFCQDSNSLKEMTKENTSNNNLDTSNTTQRTKKDGLLGMKTRKRKGDESNIDELGLKVKASPNENPIKSTIVVTKAAMKFRDKSDINLKDHNCSGCSSITSVIKSPQKSQQQKNQVTKTNVKEETSTIVQKELADNDHIKQKNKKAQAMRVKKKKMFLRSIEYNRILRNKRMITRGNLKKSLCFKKECNKKPKIITRNLRAKKSASISNIQKQSQNKIVTRASTQRKSSLPSSTSPTLKTKLTNKNKKIEVKSTKIKGNGSGYNTPNKNEKSLLISKMKAKEVEENKTNSKFPPGWENDVFEYKKSLKVPLSLITIKRGGKEYHPTTAASHEKKCGNNKYNTVNNEITRTTIEHDIGDDNDDEYEDDDQSMNSNSQISNQSIIDILHSRAISLNKDSKRCMKSNSNKKSNRNTNRENSKKEPFSHFSVFDTEILQARTRTESRILKTKEHIREIFVGDEDRPASAPPEMPTATVSQKSIDNKASFEEKFKQYLEEMNTDFGVRIRKIKNKSGIDVSGMNSTSNDKQSSYINELNASNENGCLVSPIDNTKTMEESLQQFVIPKQEPLMIQSNDEEIIEQLRIPIVPENFKFERSSLVDKFGLEKSSKVLFKQKRSSKYRKKGSSGFDYLKKKKKLPSSKISSGQNSSSFIKQQRQQFFPKFFGKKTEEDVCKEIKSWVINKSLGQSYLHKAARLGYLDVIAYCLERLNMDPDPKDNAGYTPLHEACQQGRIDIARLLLQYGANHSQAAHSGIRPLHEASEAGQIEIIRLLLSYGADPLLTTYAGQTPIKLADTEEIEQFFLDHIDDLQSTSPNRKPWMMTGPWKRLDMDEVGYNELEDPPDFTFVVNSRYKNCNYLNRKLILKLMDASSLHKENDDCANGGSTVKIIDSDENDLIDQFEFEESDMPLPPLYILKDESSSERWLLLNDLCNILKIKSKETLLKQIDSSASSSSSTVSGTREFLRELKTTDFIEKATCLQLLCAGEKLNIQASKVVLIKYNDQVKHLLGVEKTILNI